MQFGKRGPIQCLLLVAALLVPLLAQSPASAHGQTYYVDIGGGHDSSFIASGFDLAAHDPNPCTINGRDDSYRYQKRGQNNIINLPVQAHRSVHLTLCVQHGYAQDAWTLYVNGHKLTRSTSEQSGLPIVYNVKVDAKYVTSGSLRVNLHNTSTDMDGAAVFGILYWQ